MAHDEQNPMSLEDLPEHLKSRQAGNLGSSPLVEMGQIIVPQQRSWSHLIIAATLLAVLSVGGVVSYDLMATKQMTVVVDVADPQSIPQIVSDSGGEVLSVAHRKDTTYEVKVTTRKSRSSFLEWLRKNRGVKKAALEE